MPRLVIAVLGGLCALLLASRVCADPPPAMACNPTVEAKADLLAAEMPVEDMLRDLNHVVLKEELVDPFGPWLTTAQGTAFQQAIGPELDEILQRYEPATADAVRRGLSQLFCWRLDVRDLESFRRFAQTPSGRKALLVMMEDNQRLEDNAYRLWANFARPDVDASAKRFKAGPGVSR